MDSELRRRFLQILGFDFAALDLRAARVPMSSGGTSWPINGPQRWAEVRAWWLGTGASMAEDKVLAELDRPVAAAALRREKQGNRGTRALAEALRAGLATSTQPPSPQEGVTVHFESPEEAKSLLSARDPELPGVGNSTRRERARGRIRCALNSPSPQAEVQDCFTIEQLLSEDVIRELWRIVPMGYGVGNDGPEQHELAQIRDEWRKALERLRDA
jgi:hypothetical protein